MTVVGFRQTTGKLVSQQTNTVLVCFHTTLMAELMSHAEDAG